MPDLVALGLPGGPDFVRALRDAWDAGHAVFPLDRRLPREAADAQIAAVRPDLPVEEGDALVLATSGSTGVPRGVVLTHAALSANAWAGHHRLQVDPTSDRWLACLPLTHMGGLGVVTRALLTGTPLTVHPAFDPASVEDEARRGASLTTLVPTAYRRVDASAFRAVVVGGAPVPAGLGPNTVTSYGLTETGGGIVYNGRPFEGVEVRLDDRGQVLLRGPMLLRCYRDGTDPRTADGWLPTGDVGDVSAFDDEGRLRIVGRLSDLIITGGENVWPAAVESALRHHPSVGEVAVGSRPDPEWGERVVAWVVPAPGTPWPSLDELRAAAKERLPAYAAPRELLVVDALPRTTSGKVARHRLS